MEQYISKDALVAEIERLNNVLSDPLMKINGVDYITGGKKIIKEIKFFLNSLEVIKVNLETAQMMTKAVDGDITFDYYGDDDKIYGCIAHNSFCLEDFGLKDGDKVKVIVIKED